MPLSPVSMPTVAPQAAPVAPANLDIQHFPDPSAGVDMASLGAALGLAGQAAEKYQAKKDTEYSANADYYASQFMADHQNGLVDATQLGKAMPGASPIVVGRVTQLIGQDWGTKYATAKYDAFLQTPGANDPAAQKAFEAQLDSEVSAQVQGNPFYGAGAVSGAKSVMAQHRANFEARSGADYQATQDNAFGTAAVAAARGIGAKVADPAAATTTPGPAGGPVPNPDGTVPVPLAPLPKGAATAADAAAAQALPAGSPAKLLDLIGTHESRGSYDAVIGHADNNPATGGVPVTSMTLSQVLAWQHSSQQNGQSGAIGKYQIIPSTLQGLMTKLGLPADTVYTPAVQDKLAMELLNERGYQQFKDGKITADQFQTNLAKEWASLPTAAGNGYYAGQAATASTSDLRVAMSDTSAPTNAVAATDASFGATSSISDPRRIAIGVKAIIDDAKARNDPSSLDNIPSNWSAIPQYGDQIAVAKQEIARNQNETLRNAHEAQAYAEQQTLLKNQTQILSDNAAGKTINPNVYTDAASHAFAVQIRAEGRNDPTESAAVRANLEQKLMGYGTLDTPWWDASGGANKPRDMVNRIMTNPGLTPQDKQAMLAQVPVYAAGVNLISDPQVSDAYNRMAGADLKQYLGTLTGKLGKMFGSDPISTLRDQFDGHLRDEVTSYIQDHGVPPVGAAKLAMVRAAGAQAQATLKGWIENPDGAAASPAVVPGTPAATKGADAVAPAPPAAKLSLGDQMKNLIDTNESQQNRIGLPGTVAAPTAAPAAPTAALTPTQLRAGMKAGTLTLEQKIQFYQLK